jgi:beta-galactosidase
VAFDVSGSGELVAVGNGNPHNVDSFQQPHRYTWHGRALAILRPAKKPGRVTLTAKAEGLRPASLTLKVSEMDPRRTDQDPISVRPI